MGIKEKLMAKYNWLKIKGLSPKEDDPGRLRDNTLPLSETEIAEFEALVGAKLPIEYRQFLLEVGGASFNASIWPIEPREDYSDRELFDILFGGKGEKHYDLWSAYARHNDVVPAQMIPIGENLFGDQFCLAVKGAERGKVFFWCHDEARICLTAESFEDFLNRLGPDPES